MFIFIFQSFNFSTWLRESGKIYSHVCAKELQRYERVKRYGLYFEQIIRINIYLYFLAKEFVMRKYAKIVNIIIISNYCLFAYLVTHNVIFGRILNDNFLPSKFFLINLNVRQVVSEALKSLTN